MKLHLLVALFKTVLILFKAISVPQLLCVTVSHHVSQVTEDYQPRASSASF